MPVVLSLNLDPTTSSTSDLGTIMLASMVPCMPQSPRLSGWSFGNPPLPMRLVAVGAMRNSASSTSSWLAPEAMTPPPAMMSGRSASDSILAAQSSSWGSGSGFSR